jgi:hypothetical protein
MQAAGLGGFHKADSALTPLTFSGLFSNEKRCSCNWMRSSPSLGEPRMQLTSKIARFSAK